MAIALDSAQPDLLTMLENLLPYTPLLTLAAGFAGVRYAGHLADKRELKKEERQRGRDAVHLALVLTPALEVFATDCLMVAHDTGIDPHDPNPEDLRRTIQVESPSFTPESFKVEWRSIPAPLMSEILEVQNSLHHMLRDLSAVAEFDDDPDRESFFKRRQAGYAELGMETLAIARKLRDIAGVSLNTERALQLWSDLHTRQIELEQEHTLARIHWKKEAE